MEKRWLFIVGISIIALLTIIGFFGITATTGSVIYSKCWNIEEPLEQDSELTLKMQGCIIDNDEACCPFESCPDIAKLSCS